MSEDRYLKQAVLDELKWEPSVNEAHIGVTASEGVVTLMGHVETYWEKIAAEKAARRVKGVKAVAEELDVRLPFGVKHDDSDIAAAAISRLGWDSAVPRDAVGVKVEGGWVTLTGDVDWHFQQEAAVADMRGLWGVVGVSNDINIKPRPNTAKIRDDIVLALGRSWFNPAIVDVTAEAGKVTLSGKVRTWYERDEAAGTAWAAPGTTSVQNNLAVG